MQTFMGGTSNWGTKRETEEIPNFGDVLTMEEFIECCQMEGFINYDGYGCYATKDTMFCDVILPSYVTRRNNIKNYPYVIWFNR